MPMPGRPCHHIFTAHVVVTMINVAPLNFLKVLVPVSVLGVGGQSGLDCAVSWNRIDCKCFLEGNGTWNYTIHTSSFSLVYKSWSQGSNSLERVH